MNVTQLNEKLVLVRLYGRLGFLFGRDHYVSVSSVREAIRALCIMLPGFERHLETSAERGVAYTIFNGSKNLGENDLSLNGVHDVIRIAPVITGSKKSGLFMVLAGLVILAAAIWMPGISIPVSNMMGKIAAVSILGGIAQMLAPSGTIGLTNTQDTKKSYSFGSPTNTAAAGNPVPILYGQREIGGVLISGGIYVEQQS